MRWTDILCAHSVEIEKTSKEKHMIHDKDEAIGENTTNTLSVDAITAVKSRNTFECVGKTSSDPKAEAFVSPTNNKR